MAAPTKLHYDYFTDWNKGCRVKNIQREVDRILQDAKDNKRTFDEELKAQGHRDLTAFSKSCPDFPLLGWPDELAELGSGFVLYFYFLAFLGVTLLLIFFLQIPGMVAYGAEDWLLGWNWHDWQDGWSTADDPCKCIGSNNGLEGPADGWTIAGYGTYCNTWDTDYCQADTKSRSKGCCATWCFADARCPSPPVDSTWMRNTPMSNGFVRSISACTQQSTSICAAFADAEFASERVDEARDSGFIGTAWLTPGNFGPDTADNSIIPLMSLAIVVVISFVITVVSQHQIMTDAKLDAGTTSPNDFAVLVNGLPQTATDERSIMQFFKENAVRGQMSEVVKVVIGWDFSEFRGKIKKIRELKKEMQEYAPEDEKYKVLQTQMAKINGEIMSAAAGDKASRLRSSGTVVVVFRFASASRACVRRWNSFWARWFYCDADDSCCLPKGNGFWKGASLPRFPVGTPPRPVHRLQIERASNPGDIHWEELGKTRSEKIWALARTNSLMTLIILTSFGITYGFNKLQQYIKDEGEDKDGGESYGYQALSALPAFGVAITNAALTFFSKYFGDQEFHETWTDQEFSIAAKMAVAVTINTAGVPLLANLQPKEWYENGGLIDDVFYILMMVCCVRPLFFLVDMKYRLKKVKRLKLNQKRLDGWNEVYASPTATKEEIARVNAEVEGFRKSFEPGEIQNPRHYSVALCTFMCCALYAPVLPFAALIGSAGIFLLYWVDKYMLLRRYKRPAKPYNARLAMWCVAFIRTTAPLLFSLSFFIFLSPSWADKQQVLQPFLFALVASAIITFVPNYFIRTLLGLRICMVTTMHLKGWRIADDDEAEDYYKHQYMWSKEMKYHKDHFLYKGLPEAKNPEFLSPDTAAVDVSDMTGTAYGAATALAAGGAAASVVAVRGGVVLGAGTPGAAGFRGSVAPGAPAPTAYGATAAYGAGPPTTIAVGAPAAGASAVGAPAATVTAVTPLLGASDASDSPAPTVEILDAGLGGPSPPGVVDSPPKGKGKSDDDAKGKGDDREKGKGKDHKHGRGKGDDHGKGKADDHGKGKGKGHKDTSAVWEFEGEHGWKSFAGDCQSYIEKKWKEFESGKGQARLQVKTSGQQLSVDFEKMTQKNKDKIRKIRRRETE